MATETGKKPASKPGSKAAAKSNEEIVQGFQKLRAEQRQLVSKLSELEMDLNEHKWDSGPSPGVHWRLSVIFPNLQLIWVGFCRLVIETLTDVDGDRRCFRMVGGVLVERTVKEVLPALIINRDQMIA